MIASEDTPYLPDIRNNRHRRERAAQCHIRAQREAKGVRRELRSDWAGSHSSGSAASASVMRPLVGTSRNIDYRPSGP